MGLEMLNMRNHTKPKENSKIYNKSQFFALLQKSDLL